jgi:hypothetical protein
VIYTKFQANFANLTLINLIIVLGNEMESVFQIDNLIIALCITMNVMSSTFMYEKETLTSALMGYNQ